jgi:hypothetical protein
MRTYNNQSLGSTTTFGLQAFVPEHQYSMPQATTIVSSRGRQAKTY